jgi:hypothetical protein
MSSGSQTFTACVIEASCSPAGLFLASYISKKFDAGAQPSQSGGQKKLSSDRIDNRSQLDRFAARNTSRYG